MTPQATLRLENKDYSLPVIVGAEGEKALDIRNLRNDSGFITYDEGYGNTGSCQSAVTYIDGEAGVLRYRGFP
ncbi:MAG TPA: citrate (Si)-synthase, partial [Opitutaceae bacterium]|nr:citrate (Si)-synthase [Opitutaceae bacterium]